MERKRKHTATTVTVTGKGDVILYEADDEVAPVKDMDGLIESMMVQLGQEKRFENWDDINIFKSITASNYQQLKDATGGQRMVAGENVAGDMDTLIELKENIVIPKGDMIATMANIYVPCNVKVTVNEGATLECGMENYGIIDVKSGATLQTTMGGNIENNWQIIINEGAVMKSQMSGQIINHDDGTINVNGTFYCGCVNYKW